MVPGRTKGRTKLHHGKFKRRPAHAGPVSPLLHADIAHAPVTVPARSALSIMF